MRRNTIRSIVAGGASLILVTTAAPASIVVSVDMDTATPGIQNSISVAPAQAFTVDLWLSVDALGVSSFAISTLFDVAELSLNPPGGPAASQPMLPAGMFVLAVPVENNALGQVYSINGATFGLGPASTSFVFGSIAFTAITPVTDASDDVSVGYFNGGIDGAFDNGGSSLMATTTFVNGTVNLVPEPGSITLLAIQLCGLAGLRTRRSC